MLSQKFYVDLPRMFGGFVIAACLAAVPALGTAHAQEEFPGLQTLKNKEMDPAARKLIDEESRLIRQIWKNDTRVKRTQLAWTRYDRAVLILGQYQKTNDVRYFNTSVELIRSATELAPHIAAFWRMQGSMALMHHDGVVSDLIALSAFRHVVRLNPLDWESRRILAELLYRGQHYELAIAEYEAYLTFNPFKIGEIANLVAMSFIQARQTRNGIALFESIATHYEETPEGIMGRALLLRAQRKHEESLSELQRVLDLQSATQQNRTAAKTLLAHWTKLGRMEYED